ncbi:hypothetical protein N9I89_02245 [Porticoccaceae bacterium]|nr:hypothetical protein [Porticoccaceae bacterium]
MLLFKVLFLCVVAFGCLANTDGDMQSSQSISVDGSPLGVNGHSTKISIIYNTSDSDNQLLGIGFRIHYGSELMSFVGTENAIAKDLIVNGDGPYEDENDLDNDTATDNYIIFGWAALNGDWPNTSLPAKLVDVVFNINWETSSLVSVSTPINFSKIDASEGYSFEATNYIMNILPATWDFDGNGEADALTDGLILLRHAFGVSGPSLTNGVMALNSTMSSEEVAVAVEKAAMIADVDGNGEVNALTDALIVLRYLFGLRDQVLVDGVIASDATRISVEAIEQHIELFMPYEISPSVQSDAAFFIGDWKIGNEDFADERGRVDGNLDWETFSNDEMDPCIVDDIYTFASNGSFTYEVGTGTYNFIDMAQYSGDEIQESEDGCIKNFYPFDGTNDMTFEVNEVDSTLTLNGKGAYILWPDMANGIDTIPQPYFAPEQIIYDYTIISENEIQLYIRGYFWHTRFTIERMINN